MVIQPILISMVNRCVSQWVKSTHQTIGIFLCVVFCDCKTKDRVKSFEKHERIEKKKIDLTSRADCRQRKESTKV